MSAASDHMQGRPCGFSGQRCADSAVLHVPKCHLPPKQIPGLLHNGLPLRLLQPEPSRRLLRGSEELPSRDGIHAPGWPPEAVTSSWSQALGHFVLAKEAFKFSDALATYNGAFSKGLHELLRDLSNLASRELFDLQDRCLPADTWRDQGRWRGIK